MPISTDQARDIAKAFLDASHRLGIFRFANWANLDATQRRTIEDAEWDLLNYASSFTTTAVGIALADMDRDLQAIANSTAMAKKALAAITEVKDVINVAAALVVVGGAIASQNPGAIASAAGDLFDAAKSAIDRKKA